MYSFGTTAAESVNKTLTAQQTKPLRSQRLELARTFQTDVLLLEAWRGAFQALKATFSIEAFRCAQ
jgi:hypothetical protein